MPIYVDMSIERLAYRYILACAAISALLFLAMWAVSAFRPEWRVMAPAIVGGSFTFTVAVVFAFLWKWMATKHQDSLTAFYTATSGFRMLLALATLFVCYLFVGRDAMASYVLVFMVFYLVQTGFHSIYFARIANKQ